MKYPACNACSDKVKRRKEDNGASRSASSLRSHLKRRHLVLYKLSMEQSVNVEQDIKRFKLDEEKNVMYMLTEHLRCQNFSSGKLVFPNWI